MPIDPIELRAHLQNYAEVTGSPTERFVCPITLEAVEMGDLINGHILNKKLGNASKRTVIQFARVDHFYGSRVEESLVHYLNLTEATKEQFVRHSQELTVRYKDGEELAAFVAEGEAAMRAASKFPLIPLQHEGRPCLPIFVKTGLDDPRLREGRVELVASDRWMPSHWVAAMMKAGFLTL